jgi:molybdopterin molybdotransferase
MASSCFAPRAAEDITLHKALGAITAIDHLALCDLPPFAAAKVDGWAIAGPGPWQITGTALAHEEPGQVLSAGQAFGVATGGAVPFGCTAVLKAEECEVDDEYVRFVGAPSDNSNIRPQGAEALVGDLLVARGKLLGERDLALLATAGYDTVQVITSPTVEFLICGDELVEKGLPAPGAVRDSLSILLPSLCVKFGWQPIATTRVADSLADLTNKLRATSADLVITTGSTAAGPVDYLHAAIAEIGGKYIFNEVAVRPGFHQALVQLGQDRFLLALPGNPQSAVAALVSLLPPLTAGLTESNNEVLPLIECPAATLETETRLVAAEMVGGMANEVPFAESSMLRGLAQASGFAVVDSAVSGGPVRWLKLP